MGPIILLTENAEIVFGNIMRSLLWALALICFSIKVEFRELTIMNYLFIASLNFFIIIIAFWAHYALLIFV